MKNETKQLLYTFEHHWLPQLFFRQKEVITEALARGDSAMIFRILESMAEQAEVKCPFTEADLAVEVEGYPIDRYIVRVTFPEPGHVPLCHFACLCFNKGLDDLRYLTVEKSGGFEGDERPFLCGWTEDGRHENYGPCSFEEAYDKCVGLYLGEYKVHYLEEDGE